MTLEVGTNLEICKDCQTRAEEALKQFDSDVNSYSQEQRNAAYVKVGCAVLFGIGGKHWINCKFSLSVRHRITIHFAHRKKRKGCSRQRWWKLQLPECIIDNHDAELTPWISGFIKLPTKNNILSWREVSSSGIGLYCTLTYTEFDSGSRGPGPGKFCCSFRKSFTRSLLQPLLPSHQTLSNSFRRKCRNGLAALQMYR